MSGRLPRDGERLPAGDRRHPPVSHATSTFGGVESLRHDRPHPLCRGIRPERPANSFPLAPRNIHTDTERAGSRLIPPRSIRLADILMNGRARCHVPAPGTAVPQA